MQLYVASAKRAAGAAPPFFAPASSPCQCDWNSLSSIIDHWGNWGSVLAPWAGPGHWHDADMLLIGNGCISLAEERTQMAIWSIIASPLIMGCVPAPRPWPIAAAPLPEQHSLPRLY